VEPPRLLADLLIWSRQCFTTPAFTTFVALCVGFLAQPGGHTITGMLVGARLAACGITPERTASSLTPAGRRIRSAWSCWMGWADRRVDGLSSTADGHPITNKLPSKRTAKAEAGGVC
jgi:hypothetical protein